MLSIALSGFIFLLCAGCSGRKDVGLLGLMALTLVLMNLFAVPNP